MGCSEGGLGVFEGDGVAGGRFTLDAALLDRHLERLPETPRPLLLGADASPQL